MVTLPRPQAQQAERLSRAARRPATALVVVVATASAFWWSLGSLLTYTLAETALGFAPVMPVLALAAALLSALRHRSARPLAREPFLDHLLGGGLLAAAVFLVARSGSDEDWYYWLERWDLLALVLWSYGLVVWTWGLGALVRHRWAALYALLVWPVPFIKLQEWTSPLLADVTALLVRPLAEGVGVPLEPATSDFTRFVSTAPDHPFVILITSACSGSLAMLAVLTVGLLVLMCSTGDRFSKLGWLLVGLGLALLSNVVRVATLLAASAAAGVELGLGVVHPILGTILLLPIFVGLWALLAPFGIRPVTISQPGAALRSWLATRVKPGSSTLVPAVMFVALTLAVAVMDARLQVYAEVMPDQVVAFNLADPRDYLPKLPGWTLEPRDEISWQNLFGPDSRSQVFIYRSAETPWTVVQLVATRDRRSLARYTPEQCGLYHGEEMIANQRVDLGAGQTGQLVETASRQEFGAGRLIQGSLLYWYAPVEVDGQVWHLRVVLLLDTDAVLSPLPDVAVGGAEPERVVVNQHLVRLARAIVAANTRPVSR